MAARHQSPLFPLICVAMLAARRARQSDAHVSRSRPFQRDADISRHPAGIVDNLNSSLYPSGRSRRSQN